uniref:Uncharacterized protein n=1 Tax=Rhizophora mucronata TaxID=61149 RepID=A0A2P2NUF8_RHIMU
MTSSCQHVKLI